jgi:hypothetical protein
VESQLSGEQPSFGEVQQRDAEERFSHKKINPNKTRGIVQSSASLKNAQNATPVPAATATSMGNRQQAPHPITTHNVIFDFLSTIPTFLYLKSSTQRGNNYSHEQFCTKNNT